MTPSFRSAADWEAALMTLPDSAYFELMRSMLGNIKTPFNKQRLMGDLGAFLSRREIQEIIAAYIDQGDAKIIAAVAMLGEPLPEELENFFAGEFTYAELHGMILNLEERLILYRFRDGGACRFALNPLLRPALAPFIADRDILFPSTAAPSHPPGRGAGSPEGPDNRLFAALISFVCDEREFYKAEGGIRKKVLEDGEKIFPGLRLDLHVGGLQCLGLLKLEGERLEADEEKLAFFKELSPLERFEYYAAGMAVFLMYADSSLRYFHRGQIQVLASLVHGLIGALDPGRLYPALTLRRLMELLDRENENKEADKGIVFESLLKALDGAGLLLSTEKGFRKAGCAPNSTGTGANPVIAMDTAFSCVLYPGIAFADAVALAFFCSVREVGPVIRFELTRESVVRGFNRGMDAAAMTELLHRLSGSRMDPNLAWTLKDWENRYSGVSLYQGIVLTLSAERRYLAETMAPLIARNLAPGVYLLSAAEQSEAVQVLRKAGVDIIAQPPLRSGAGSGKAWHSPYPSPEGSRRGEGIFNPVGDEDRPRKNEAEQKKEHFRSVLAKMQLPKSVRDELAARIDRRLILSESQLTGVSVRYEKREAQGLDFVGKTAIAKQAIASASLVEILWPSPGGGQNRALGIPEALEKQGGETILVVRPMAKGAEPRGTPLRLPLGKISLLRRIKQSIFEG